MFERVKRAAFLILAVLLVVGLQGCDMSALFGLGDEDEEGGQTGGGSEGPQIESYILRAADNPELSFDVVGSVGSTEVRVVLSYDVVNNNVLLTPTVEVTEGATYAPSGEVGFRTDNFYEVRGVNGEVSGYNVYADVDPNTIP